MKKYILWTARQWVDTPYHHQGRVKGVGCDCIGLVIGVCQEIGLINFDFTNYERVPDSTVMMKEIEKHCKPTIDPEPGDLLVFRIKKNPQHVGILTDRGIIHAYQSIGKVVEHPLDVWWMKRNIGCFELPIKFSN
jgi:NlpC/P60 family putative phage cell wall peptidase